MTAKLTKTQREFFTAFARNIVGNTVFPVLDAQGLEFTPELAAKLLDMQDLGELTEAIGQHFLKDAEFAEIKRVFKFMQSEEFLKITTLSAQVADEVQEQLLNVVTPMIPTLPEFGKE